MKIDVSRIKAFRTCPLKYKERYGANIVKIPSGANDALTFGTRWHQLQENQARVLMGLEKQPYEACGNKELENELATSWAGYEAHYPTEPFEFVEAEKTFEVALESGGDERCDCDVWVPDEKDALFLKKVYNIKCPKCKGSGFQPKHFMIGKIDGIIKYPEGDYAIFETKTEKRGGKDNCPEAWAARLQVGVYIWAAKQLWPEREFRDILLNVVTRQSPAGREPATFRRDNLVRTPSQIESALADVVYWADRMQELEEANLPWELWPRNTEQCVVNKWPCEYYKLHTFGRDPGTLSEFQPAEDYLGGL